MLFALLKNNLGGGGDVTGELGCYQVGMGDNQGHAYCTSREA